MAVITCVSIHAGRQWSLRLRATRHCPGFGVLVFFSVAYMVQHFGHPQDSETPSDTRPLTCSRSYTASFVSFHSRSYHKLGLTMAYTSSAFYFASIAMTIGILSVAPPISALEPNLQTHSSPPEAKAVTELWQFPNLTWVENLAVRSNGKVLVTFLSSPEVWQVDPHKKSGVEPFLVAQFPNVLGATGISEVEKDVFAVAVANWSTKALQIVDPHSCSIWSVDVRSLDPRTGKGVKTRKIADVPEAIFLNGMVTLNSKRGLILVADSGNGWIYSVNTLTGEYKVVLDDTTLKPTNILALGVNGIRLRDGFLYYSNSAQGQFGRVKLNSKDGTAEGPYTLIAGNGFADDFEVDPDPQGVVYTVTDPFNDLKTISLEGNVNTILGSLYSPLLAGDTSARFGRTEKTRRTLYVTTNGGIVRPVNGKLEGGKVLAVDLTELGH